MKKDVAMEKDGAKKKSGAKKVAKAKKKVKIPSLEEADVQRRKMIRVLEGAIACLQATVPQQYVNGYMNSSVLHLHRHVRQASSFASMIVSSSSAQLQPDQDPR
ncbi:MAG: hypothetical protein WC683_01895 [bacterium]